LATRDPEFTSVDSQPQHTYSLPKNELDLDLLHRQPLNEIRESWQPIENEQKSRTIEQSKRKMISKFVENQVANDNRLRDQLERRYNARF